MNLPTDHAAREELPLYDFMFGYFPDAWLEVVKVAWEGNKQHNPGERMHWARHKSTDHMNKAFRHQFDHGKGRLLDKDGTYHIAKAIWRLMAELQNTVDTENQASQKFNVDTIYVKDVSDPKLPTPGAPVLLELPPENMYRGHPGAGNYR